MPPVPKCLSLNIDHEKREKKTKFGDLVSSVGLTIKSLITIDLEQSEKLESWRDSTRSSSKR